MDIEMDSENIMLPAI